MARLEKDSRNYSRRYGKEKIEEEWRKEVITPIYKKGDTSDVKNYKRVTLLCIAYKIYAAILAERLKGEIEGKGNLPKT